ncbi:MAG TPA: hypothetical protein VM285_13850, partial [Polyangia bacterium]|nr:hypothetical protein [Polyangia bacterium]
MELKTITSLESLRKGRRAEIGRAVEALEAFQPAQVIAALEHATFPNTADRQARVLLLGASLAYRNRPLAAIKVLSESRDRAKAPEDIILARRILDADLRVETGRASEARPVAEECRARAESAGLKNLYIEAAIVEGAALSAMGFQLNAMRALKDAAEKARNCGTMYLVTLALARLSACHYRAGEILAAMTAAGNGVQSSPTRQGIGYGIAQRHMALAFGVQGDHSAAIEWHRKARTTFAACGYLPGEIRNYLSLGLTHINMGDLVVAGHYLKRADELNRDGDNPALATIIQSRLGTLALSKADPLRAIEHFQRDADSTGEMDDASGKGYAARNLARAHKAAGRPDESAGCFLRAVVAFEKA